MIARPLRLLLGYLIVPTVCGCAAPGAGALVNAGFEDPDLLGAWKSWVYPAGKEPVIRTDPFEPKEGGQSLLVAAEEPADVAIAQVVTLPTASAWRVRCWVRTENLVPRDPTDTGGAVHVQTPEGATLARGPSAFGTTSWHEVAVPFRVPAGGQIKVVLFYIGYGKGTGKAWFDDVRLEPVFAAGEDEIRITSERLSRRPVDAKQGGQFIEPLCGLIPSMLAQQVANTSFEVEPPWKVAFRPETDKPRRPWYPDGAVHLARFTYDTNQPFNGGRSLRVELPAAHARAGVSQDGFYLQKGCSYRLRLHARSESGVEVRATLHGGGSLVADAALLGRSTARWTPFESRLRAARTLENATLTLDFEGPGTLWLDRVSLVSEDAVLGLWRPDVVQALRELQPAVIRFGGSALEGYAWDQALGSPENRAPFPLPYWGGLDENFVGVEEFVALCHEVGAEPLVCVRWTGRKPADAAAEVEYFNGAPNTPWGERRARNGHPQPWAVKYWQIGNEVSGPGYDASVREFAEAMRGVDPSIKVLSSFPSAEILAAARGQLDYLCPHHYGCADLLAMDRDFLALEAQIRRAASPRPVRIAVTEWNTTAGDWELRRATLLTLANALACARYHHLLHRHADAVEIAIRSNLIDSFGSGVLQTGPGWMYRTPTYHAQRLYARAAGSYPLRVDRGRGNPPGAPEDFLAEPDVSALLSADGRTLRVYGVNSTDRAIATKTSLLGLGAGVVKGERHTLKDSRGSRTPEVFNSRDEPDAVRVFRQPARVHGQTFNLEFEPFSLTLYELELGKVGRQQP